MEFEFVSQRAGQAIEVGKQRRLRDIHPIKFAHALIANFADRHDEFDQRIPGTRVLFQDRFNRFIQNSRYQERPRLRNQPSIHRIRLAHPYERSRCGKKVLPETTRFFEIQPVFFLDLNGIARPNYTLFGRVMQREERRNIGRPCEVQEPCRCAMILHEGEPLEIVVAFRYMIEKMDGFAFEDSEDALLLARPGSRVDAKRHQISRKSAEQWCRRVALAAKRPVLIRRIADDGEILFP